MTVLCHPRQNAVKQNLRWQRNRCAGQFGTRVDYSVSISTTSRPRYWPHSGQTR